MDVNADSSVFPLGLQDIASYNKEQATGDDRHNILTIAMHQFNTDFDGAMAWVASYHKEVEARFLAALERVPSWCPAVDAHVAVYLEHLGGWPRCNDCWNFESGRYFGSKGAEYKRTRLVPLLPKRVQNPAARRENVEVPLVDDIGVGQKDVPLAQVAATVSVAA